MDFNLRTSGLLFLAIHFPQGVKSNTPHRHDYLKKKKNYGPNFFTREKKRQRREKWEGKGEGEGEDILICKPSIKPRLPIKVLSFRTLELTRRPS